MDILHNLSVTGHKLHDKIILYSWISEISTRDKKSVNNIRLKIIEFKNILGIDQHGYFI